MVVCPNCSRGYHTNCLTTPAPKVHSTAQRGVAWHGMVCGVAYHGMVCGVAWHGMVCGVAWHSMGQPGLSSRFTIWLNTAEHKTSCL